jgi:error-prone DNA polymerase
MTDYAELHLHSCWSLLEGASTPEELVLRALELGYDTLALTDHDGLYGAMEFAQICKANGIRPITGAELTLAPHPPPAGNREPGTRNQEPGTGNQGRDGDSRAEGEGHHLTLLAADRSGYSHLCRLITHAYAHDRLSPSLDPSLLAEYAGGLICLSGCRKSRLARLVTEGRYREAEAWAKELRDWFGRENFYVELQNNLVYGDRERNRRLAELAESLGVGTVATGNVHYHVRERHRLQDVLVAIKHRTTLDGCHRERRENSEYYLKSPAEMAELFRDYPRAVANSRRIAERCMFDLTRDLDYRFPDFTSEKGESADGALERLCRQRLGERYGPLELGLRREAEERLGEELRLIRHHKLSGFFLVYRDLLELAKEVAAEVRGKDSARALANLPPGRGRGSSVSSLVCYLIGLSHVDPVKSKLFLGRFLNEELASVPDIDLDFARDIREQLILRVYERYGHEHAALVASFATYKIRSAVRDVGKALGLPEAELDKLAKRSEGGSAKNLRDEMQALPEFRDRVNALLWRDLVELAEELAGMPRHVSQHVGGMVIASQPLVDLVPVQPAAWEGRYICQWDKDSVDDARFIKVDFLALGMLSAVEECLELIVESGKRPVDLSRIPYDDPAVYDDICRADTVGVFQVESRAQMQTLPRTQPRSMEDLAVQVAIIRPGPIVGGAVNPYVRRRQVEREQADRPPDERDPVAVYDHPLLEPVLKDTLGVVLFQDQVLEVAMALAGFTAGQGEALRRAMSRKRSHAAMASFWEEFRAGAARKGVPEPVARRIFDKLLAFSEFGFPKSHAAAFAVLAYQSAWLRRYYPTEFYTALFNAQPMGFYPPHVLTNDARRHGIDVLPPEVNRSGARCTAELLPDGREGLRIGFAYVRGVGAAAALRIERERRERGEYRSLTDFVRRLGLSDGKGALKREGIESLIQVGAFDGFGLPDEPSSTRRELLWQLGLLYRPPSVQFPLPLPTAQDEVPLSDLTDWERLKADYAVLNLSPSYHPMQFLRPYLGEGVVGTAHLSGIADGSMVDVAGLVVCRQRPGTAKGFVFLLMEDEFGMANVVVRPDLYARYRSLVRVEPFIRVRGRLERRDGTTNLLAEELKALALPRSLVAPEANEHFCSRKHTTTKAGEGGQPLAVPEAHNFG